jgi:uncharacterized metal-binding protein YceD (DUF177 family)
MTDEVWSQRIALAEVPDEGLHVAIEADPVVRAALARIANLRELSRLEASFDLRRTGPDKLHVTGEVSALVGQNCVITLEPVERNLYEAVDLVFAPEPSDTIGDAEASFGVADAEPLVGGTVDLGAIATEYFLLGIDPYPRKEGAVFEATAPVDPALDSPFAALGALKKPPSGGK